VRFRLPDPVLALSEREQTPGTWMSDEDANKSVMIQVPGVGPFVRALLPVSLIGGDTLTFGLWLSVPPDDFQRAFREWWAPTYPELVLEGRIANDVQPWSLLARSATATVPRADQTPYLTESDDDLVRQVITQEWPHEPVLDALPNSLR
jgi:hypothetical protein